MMNNELKWKYFETILEIICFIIEFILFILTAIKFYDEKSILESIVYLFLLLVFAFFIAKHGISLRNKLIKYINKKWRKNNGNN